MCDDNAKGLGSVDSDESLRLTQKIKKVYFHNWHIYLLLGTLIRQDCFRPSAEKPGRKYLCGVANKRKKYILITYTSP